MDIKLIDTASRRYRKYSLWVVVALTLVVIVAISLNVLDITLVNALAVSVLYTLIVNFAYGSLWRKVAKYSLGVMTKFYLVASVLRLMTAALVVVVFCMLSQEKVAIRNFVLLFFTFYIVMLIFDSVFFARIEKSNNRINK